MNRRAEKLIDFLAGLGLLVAVAVPAIASFVFNFSNSGTPVVAESFWLLVPQMLFSLLQNLDAGGFLESTSGIICCSVFFASTVWLLRLRQLVPQTKHLFYCCGAFLAVLAISSLSSQFAYSSLTQWLNYVAIVTAGALGCQLARTFSKLQGQGSEQYNSFLGKFLYVLAGLFTVLLMGTIWQSNNVPAGTALFGAFYQSNMLAGYVLLGLPLWLIVAFNERDCGLRTLRLWSAVLSFLSLYVLYFTYNRNAWLCALGAVVLIVTFWKNSSSVKLQLLRLLVGTLTIVSLFAAALLWMRAQLVGATLAWIVSACLGMGFFGEFRRNRKVIGTVLLLSLLVLSSIWLVPYQSQSASKASNRLQTIAAGRDNSLAARVDFYKGACQIAAHHPLWGVGLGGFQRYFPQFQPDFRWYAKHVHSITLTLLCEAGLPALLLFYGIICLGLIIIWRNIAEDCPFDGKVRLGLALGCVVFLVHAQADVDFNFLSLPLLAALFFGIALGSVKVAELAGTPVGAELSEQTQVGENIASLQAGDDLEPASEWTIRPRVLRQFVLAGLSLALLAWSCYLLPGQYYYSLGKLNAMNENHSAALYCYREATRLNPLDGNYHLQLCTSLNSLMKSSDELAQLLPEFTEHAFSCVTIDPHRAATQNFAGRALELSGKWNEAIPYYERSLELDPVNVADSYLDLARVYMRCQQTDKAIAVLHQAAERFNEAKFKDMFDFRTEELAQSLSQVYLALANIDSHSPEQYRQYMQRALRLQPELFKNYCALAAQEVAAGDRAAQSQQWGAARQSWQRALQAFQSLYAMDAQSDLQNSITSLQKKLTAAPQ